jgi:hypothetical protein
MTEFAHFKFSEPGLDEDECLAGYWAGYRNDPEPGSDKSRSFFHGWRNGRVDGGHAQTDRDQEEYARRYVAAIRAH